jgi:hypothetical protein
MKLQNIKISSNTRRKKDLLPTRKGQLEWQQTFHWQK